MSSSQPITHGGQDRLNQLCRCARCGTIEICTPLRDFFGSWTLDFGLSRPTLDFRLETLDFRRQPLIEFHHRLQLPPPNLPPLRRPEFFLLPLQPGQ